MKLRYNTNMLIALVIICSAAALLFGCLTADAIYVTAMMICGDMVTSFWTLGRAVGYLTIVGTIFLAAAATDIYSVCRLVKWRKLRKNAKTSNDNNL